MKTIVGIRFKKPGKIYFFDPGDIEFKLKDYAIVETSVGEEYAEVAMANKQIPEERIIAPLRKVIRKATYKDRKHYEENKRKEKEAFKVAENKIKKHKLKMNLTDVEYKFDNSKITFYFTSDGRVDFRELVKDLAAIYKTRIELRQIGVRDEVRRIGGNGVCGRELCCCSFLNNFDAVSIKMAKEQNLSLNPTKISGICGRLMCCLNYEQNTYEDIRKRLPKVGSIVETVDGKGEVTLNNTVKESVKVKTKIGDEEVIKEYKIDDVKLIKGSYEGIINDKDIKLEIESEEDKKLIKNLINEK